MSNVTVIGIGAMGGGMARALLKSSTTSHVIGYDLNQEAVAQFHKESQALGKAWSSSPPSNLKDAVIMEDGNVVDYVILVLVNETQCDATCFSQDSGDCLLDILSEGSCVVLSSTVTATWAKSASEKFKTRHIDFLDCPISGGPVRAAAGDLTLMASGPDLILEKARPLFASMGEAHLIDGGAGMGSTVKMVHQLLAGVHICAAAEALALAAKAGIDVDQMYKIVNSAAGASWMFQDRGQRMIAETEEVKSALAIHVKDLDIVYSEAKSLGSPIPLASSALQQFITGQILGYGRKDDSQVVKVYENATKVSVAKVNTSTNDIDKSSGDDHETNKMLQDGSEKVIVDDCCHKVLIYNNYIRALRVSLPPKSVSSVRSNGSLTFCLTEQGMDLVTHVHGSDSQIQNTLEFGQVCYDFHESEQVQKITNMTGREALYMAISILNKPPVVASAPLVADHHTLVPSDAPNCRVYKLVLDAGESVTVSYPFFYCTIVLETSSLKIERSGMDWEEVSKRGDVHWREPCLDLRQTNIGDSPYVVLIMECV